VAVHDGYKSPSEDRYTILSQPDLDLTLLAVFDGHGSSYISNAVNAILPHRVFEKVKLLPAPDPQVIEQILIREFEEVQRLLRKRVEDGGSTGTVCVITPAFVITANVGDAPALLFTRTDALLETTVDHDCDNPVQQERMRLAGNICVPGKRRTLSGLAPTRNFGDSFHRGVIATPQTYIWARPTEGILAVCSDSFSEAISHDPKLHIGPYQTREEIVKELNESINTTAVLQEAVTNAVLKQVEKFNIGGHYYGDNTTLILMEL
jgi:serine/threonine protein phosphatase PrpC